MRVTVRPLDRIIPARAGFTAGTSTARMLIRDHPRSRGVYLREVNAECGYQGSSPLARGLRIRIGRALLRRRIIPARAGFTSASRGMILRGMDHPRSRGVYSEGRASTKARSWIIPARAGFTTSTRAIPTGSRDHPRSRGVYSTRAASRCGAGGIIPARAGFTTAAGPAPGCVGDHPRSRGVYSTWASVAMMHAGSSPLARGLRGGGHRCVPFWGIIPARAGFTRRGPSWTTRGRDHPRSRGVYTPWAELDDSWAGSSPLARGLLALSGGEAR